METETNATAICAKGDMEIILINSRSLKPTEFGQKAIMSEAGEARLCPPCSSNTSICQDQEAPVSCPCQLQDRSPNKRGNWRQVHSCGRKRVPSLPTLPPHMPLSNRFEALLEDSQV